MSGGGSEPPVPLPTGWPLNYLSEVLGLCLLLCGLGVAVPRAPNSWAASCGEAFVEWASAWSSLAIAASLDWALLLPTLYSLGFDLVSLALLGLLVVASAWIARLATRRTSRRRRSACSRSR